MLELTLVTGLKILFIINNINAIQEHVDTTIISTNNMQFRVKEKYSDILIQLRSVPI